MTYVSDARMQSCLNGVDTNKKFRCWDTRLRDEIRLKGTTQAFAFFSQLYVQYPEFGARCHDATHTLGDAAYAQFKLDGIPFTDPVTRFCGYGFYHGFIDRMLIEQGQEYFKDARDYCDSLDAITGSTTASMKKLARDACYHGIGHALFDSVESRYWGDADQMVQSAIRNCVAVNDDEHFWKVCASGVFNSLAIAESARTYNLSFDANPEELCKKQKPSHQLVCYSEVLIGYIREKKFDTRQSLEFVSTRKPESLANQMTYIYIDDEVKRQIAGIDLASFYDTCQSVRPQARRSCIDGVLSGLLTASEPGREETHMIPFCQLYARTEDRAYCFSNAIKRLESINTREKLISICAQVPNADRVLVGARCVR